MIRTETAGTTTGNALQPPTPVSRLTLAADSGIEVALLDLGAAIDSVRMPGRGRAPEPVTLSLDTVADREDPDRNPYFGVTVGRFANRIAGARFSLDGVEHRLLPNEGVNQLHGGPIGFSHVVWDLSTDADDTVGFHRTSPAGEMGFPGSLDVTVTYRLAGSTLAIEYVATTDAPTVVSLTNHAYWNLGGPAEADVRDHVVTVDADLVVPVDGDMIPTGSPVDVTGTPFDLRTPIRLGDRIGDPFPGAFDHCMMVSGSGLRRHARIEHPGSGRALEVWSDKPGAQLYTGVLLPGGPGAHGRSHVPFSGLCVEPQHVPDAPNLSWAPSPVLRPGERYVHRLELRFEEI